MLAALLTSSALFGQQAEVISLDLGIVAATASAGDLVEMPVSLKGAGEAVVAAVSVEIACSGTELEVVEFRRNPALADAAVRAEVGRSDQGDHLLKLEIRSDQGIPPGELGKIEFRIAPGVQLGATISVRNLGQSAEDIHGERLDTAGIDGSILVLGHVSACFFYMH